MRYVTLLYQTPHTHTHTHIPKVHSNMVASPLHHRIHSIELPHTVPRLSFERDLDFYGIVLKEGEIKEKSFDMIASLRQDRDNAKSDLNEAQRK